MGKLEERISEIVYTGKGTMEDIDRLFKEGADPNYYDEDREKSIFSTFFLTITGEAILKR